MNHAKKLGIKVEEVPGVGNSFYAGSIDGKLDRMKDAIIRKLGRKGYLKKLNEKLDEKEFLKSGNPVLESIGKDRIILDKSLAKNGNLGSNAALSHELGHSHYMGFSKGRSKNIIAKAAHRLYTPGAYMVSDDPVISKSFKLGKKERQLNVSGSNLTSGGFAAHGFINGLKSAKLKHEGKKESKLHKLASAALPAAMVAPLLVAEGSASLKGLKLLKKAGASKAAMKESRKLLGKAWGTYAGKAAKPILSGQLGREAGKLAGNVYYKFKDKKKENKDEKHFSRAAYLGLGKREAQLMNQQRTGMARMIRQYRKFGYNKSDLTQLGIDTPEYWKNIRASVKNIAKKEVRDRNLGIAGAATFGIGTGYKVANKIRNNKEEK